MSLFELDEAKMMDFDAYLASFDVKRVEKYSSL